MFRIKDTLRRDGPKAGTDRLDEYLTSFFPEYVDHIPPTAENSVLCHSCGLQREALEESLEDPKCLNCGNTGTRMPGVVIYPHNYTAPMPVCKIAVGVMIW